jgi:hypothetical protein
VRRWLLFAVLTVALSGALALSGAFARADGHAAATGARAQAPLVGTWQRTTTCVELAAALGKAGLQKWVLEQVAGNGFIPGVRTPDQVADRTNPCKGAVPRKHSHFFTRSGAFGSLDWRGQPVEDGTYRLGSNGTAVTIFKEFPKVTFKYRIVGQDGHVHPADSEGLLLVQVRMGHIGRVSRQVLAAHPLSRLRRQGSAVLLRHRSCESPPAFSLTQRSSSLHGTSTSRP